MLNAHRVGLVELIFRRERPGWVLRVTIENPTSIEPGAGITLDACAEVSRDLSAAFDVADLIKAAYTLEVTSPGLERPLYDLADYTRFSGQMAKVVLHQPRAGGAAKGQASLRGRLQGTEGDTLLMTLETAAGAEPERIAFGEVKHGHLLYAPPARGAKAKRPSKHAKTRPE